MDQERKKLFDYSHAVRLGKLRHFLQRCTAKNRWAVALAAAADAANHGIRLGVGEFSRCIMVCAAAGKPKSARFVYDKVGQFGLKHNDECHTGLVTALAMAGEWQGATSVYNAVRGKLSTEDARRDGLFQLLATAVHKPRPGTYSADWELPVGPEGSVPKGAISPQYIGRLPSWHWAMHTFLQEMRRSRGEEGLMLSRPVYRLLVHVCAASSQWRTAIGLIQSASARVGAPCAKTYDKAVEACYRAQKPDHVVWLTERMIAARLQPHEVTTRMALEAAEDVAAGSLRPQLRAGSWALACVLLLANINQGLPVELRHYENCIRAAALCGQWEASMRGMTLLQSSAAVVPPYLMKFVLCAKIRDGTHSGAHAWDIYSALPALKPLDALTANSVAQAALQHRDFAVFAKVRAAMQRSEVDQNEESRALAVTGYALQGNWVGAIDAFVNLSKKLVLGARAAASRRLEAGQQPSAGRSATWGSHVGGVAEEGGRGSSSKASSDAHSKQKTHEEKLEALQERIVLSRLRRLLRLGDSTIGLYGSLVTACGEVNTPEAQELLAQINSVFAMEYDADEDVEEHEEALRVEEVSASVAALPAESFIGVPGLRP